MLNKPFLFMMMLGTAAVLSSGCISMKAHLEDRARVDQEIPGQGPAPVKTRKVVVLEVVEKGKSTGDTVVKTTETRTLDKAGQTTVMSESSETTVAHDSNFSFPGQTPQTLTQGAASGEPIDYKVEKDDTLQKIAKKFYGSYGQWTKIYDANKEVIKNPNFVKPGVMLKIPAPQKSVEKKTE